MRLHVVSLPHTQTTSEYLHCAYTQKIVKFTKMMVAQGHEVYLYSGEKNEAVCTEHITLISEAERTEWYGPWDPNGLFSNLDWSPDALPWLCMNGRAIAEISKRAQPHDTLCLVAGLSQKPIGNVLEHTMMPVEWAVGYEGIAGYHRVFESYAWMHHIYGLNGMRDGAAFDTVIPNFFDPADFFAVDDPARPEREDFLLFTGRIVARKGPHVAAEIAKRLGRKLVVAGPGVTEVAPGRISAPEISIVCDGIEYVGTANREQRADLMARAAAVIVPTLYIEPFGGVAVEAMMSGTPVVASDWGAFTETVQNGVSGYRFSTLAEGAGAVLDCEKLDPETIRQYALDNYSLDAVGPRFTSFFERLNTRWGDGWYT